MTADPIVTPTEPRWLTADERAAWLSLVGIMIKLPSALDAQLQRDAGLSFYEYMVLAILSEQDDRTLRMSALAGFTNGSLSRLSHVVGRLERHGWARREPSADDGRSINAVLTDDGYRKVLESAPGHVENVHELVIDALTGPELDGLRRAGDAIMARVDPTHC